MPRSERQHLPLNCVKRVLILIAALGSSVHSNHVSAQLPVRLTKLDGTSQQGRLLSFSRARIKLLAGGEQIEEFACREIISLRPVDPDEFRVVPLNRGPWILLATGERLRMNPLTIDDESVIGAWSHFEALPPQRVPLEVCRGMSFGGVLPTGRFGQTIRTIMRRTEKSDLLRLGNGDQLAGEFIELKNNEIVLETDLGESKTPLSFARLLAFNPELVSVPDEMHTTVTALLRDGSLLKFSKAASDGDTVLGTSISGFQIQFPVTLLYELQFSGPKTVRLSSLDPEDVELQTLLTMERPPVRNASVLGEPLMLRGRPFATGLGVLSGTAMTWTLGKQFRHFQATAGIDDAAARGGSADFEVLVDGKSVWKSDVVTGNSPAVRLPVIDLAGAESITLRVGTAERGNVLDYADWCDAVLIRAD